MMQPFTKHMRPMSPATEETLKRLAALDLTHLNETDVREAFLAPGSPRTGYGNVGLFLTL
jgi:hypothetical protein